MNLAVAAVFWIAGLTGDRPALATELPFLDLSPGQEFVVVGWYQSRMGDRLTLDECKYEFDIDRDSNYPALRAFDLRATSLSIRCRVQHGEAPGSIKIKVLGIIEGPNHEELLETVRITFDTTPRKRRLAVVNWVFSLKPEENPDANFVAIELFERTLARVDGADAEDGELEFILKLFQERQAILRQTPLWDREITRLANQSPPTESIEKIVRDLGFVESGNQWISETEFLASLRMVRRGDTVVTTERNALEEIADAWSTSGKRKALLRGLTNTQYESYVRKRELHEGMKRTEALTAWGYPDQVTWVDRDDQRFELWVFEDRQVHLVDDLVFGWVED